MSVQVWQTRRGAWRWRYLDPPGGQEGAGSRADLPNLSDHGSAEAAAAAARTAYPGARVDIAAPSQGQPVARWRLWTGRVALAVVVVLAARRALRERGGR